MLIALIVRTRSKIMPDNTDAVTPVDKWIEAVPADVYALCPCGCGKKWKFVLQESEDSQAMHYTRWLEKNKQ